MIKQALAIAGVAVVAALAIPGSASADGSGLHICTQNGNNYCFDVSTLANGVAITQSPLSSARNMTITGTGTACATQIAVLYNHCETVKITFYNGDYVVEGDTCSDILVSTDSDPVGNTWYMGYNNNEPGNAHYFVNAHCLDLADNADLYGDNTSGHAFKLGAPPPVGGHYYEFTDNT